MDSKDQIHYDIAELLEKIAHLNIKLASAEKIHPVELDLLRSYLRELDKLADSMPLMQLPKPTFAQFKAEPQPSSLPSFNTPQEAKAITEPYVEKQTQKPLETVYAAAEQEAIAKEPQDETGEASVTEVAQTPGGAADMETEDTGAEVETHGSTSWSWEKEPESETKQGAHHTAVEDEAKVEPEDNHNTEETAEEETELYPPATKPENQPEPVKESELEKGPEEEVAWIRYGEADKTTTAEPQAETQPEEEPWVLNAPDQTPEPEQTPEHVTKPAFDNTWFEKKPTTPVAPAEEPTTAEQPEGPKTADEQAPIYYNEQPAAENTAPTPPPTEEPTKRSLNDMFNRGDSQDVGSRFQFQNRRNLREMIDLSERYIFTKELFGGDADYYDRAIRQLNQFETLAEAQTYMNTELKPKYNWEGKENVEKQFEKIVERRFA